MQFQTPLLPIKFLYRRCVSVEALGGDVAGPDVQFLPLYVDAATGGSRIDKQSARFIHPRNRRLLRWLPTGERERPVKVASATGGSRIVIRPPPTERTTGLLPDVVSQIGLNRSNECSLVRVLHVTARFGGKIIRATFGLFAELDVTGAPDVLGETLILVEEQIWYIDVGRVPRVYHRRRWRVTIGTASRVVVVIVVINVDGGGASGNADGADARAGGNDVPGPWRWRGRLSKLSRPQPRTIGTGIGATGRRGTARASSRRRRDAAGGWARLATRVMHARTQPRTAGRRVGAEVAGQPCDRIENL